MGGGVDILLLIFKSLDGVKEETPNEREGIKNLNWYEVIVSESWGCGRGRQQRFCSSAGCFPSVFN